MRSIPDVTLAALMNRYDVFFVDQFGVLRDDQDAYDGAPAALATIKNANKTVVVLSNSGRSGKFNSDRLVALGFAPDTFDHFVTSGDVAYELLSASTSAIAPGGKCFTISSGNDQNLADRLGLVSVDRGDDADVVIISGSEAEIISMDAYLEMLIPAASRQLPCYCTNPDIHKLSNGSIAPGAGSIARIYEKLGGTVVWLGKPHREIYDYALSLIGNPDRRRVVCIGDSVEHDILGAGGADLDSVLVRTGLMTAKSDTEVATIIASTGARPTFIMGSLGL
jgi:HAD superfamily hydrolase (TIGR01459 family)